MYAGFVPFGSTVKGIILTKNAARTPTNADALPTFRVYGPDRDTALVTGTCTVLDAPNVPGGYRYSIDCTGANGFAAGQSYDVVFSATVAGVVYGPQQKFSVV